MVALAPPPPSLSADNLTLFYVVDDLITRSPILVFYGPSATATANANSSRIQAHVFSPAGLQSTPRLTISPSSPLYSAITCLPREEQSDEICRGLAFSLYKHFAELPEAVRQLWIQQPTALGKQPHAPRLLSDAHAAILATRMQKVENVAEVIRDIQSALSEQSISWLDLDLVLPRGSMKQIDAQDSGEQGDDAYTERRYGAYASIVKLFGESTFLPTSKLRRAPSKPSGLNRSVSFSRKQKENLRREIIELLDTEESYVTKLNELLHSVADEFRLKARSRGADSNSPSAQALEKLFPPSLDEILQTNGHFLDAMRTVVEETENSAISDIEATAADDAAAANADASGPDLTGALRVAKCLLEWLPKFADCYANYIQAHSQFSQFLRTAMAAGGSSFSKRVQETGEQRLTSMLIEPVQRLPRYSLYIDNIIKQLPGRHDALKLFLKARDIVSEICSRDAAATSPARMMEILETVSQSWPASLTPAGRLITAVDVLFLEPPYQSDSPKATAGILLLYTDYVVMLQKKTKQSTTARTLLSYLDNSSILPAMAVEPDLDYHYHMRLSDVEMSERRNGRLIQLLHTPSDASQRNQRPGLKSLQKSVQVVQLTGTYDGKSTKLAEEFAKARIEGRFPEAERDSAQWEVRRTADAGDLHLLTAVFEDSSGGPVQGRGVPAKIRVVVNPSRRERSSSPSNPGADILVELTIQGDSFFKMEVLSSLLNASKDQVTSAEFLAVLGKRLSNFLQPGSNIRNPKMTLILMARNQSVLQSLNIRVESPGRDDSVGSKDSGRAPSPVKLISNFFGGSSGPAKHLRGALSVDNAPRLLSHATSIPSLSDLSRAQTPYALSRIKSIGDLNVATAAAENDADSSLQQVLSTYTIALHARKGNIVGRVLQARAVSAEEVMVNELYNILLEDPSACQSAAQAPVDVLFAAFEKFVRTAWKSQFGDILPESVLRSFRNGEASDVSSQGQTFEGLPTVTQQAIKDIVKLLADLLDGTVSDGDRGILTAAFAQMLSPSGGQGSQELIPILDHLIANFEGFFNSNGQATPSKISVHAHQGSQSQAAGNGNGTLSHHSSLRKKFGLGNLHRKNSKLESAESEISSVWRTFSKTRSGNVSATIDSLMPAPLITRSKSQDNRGGLVGSPKRSAPRDRPAVMGLFADQHGLDTVGERKIGESLPSGPPRKKRRSSLSDLKELENSPAPNRLELQLPQSPRPISPGKPTSIPQRRTSLRAITGSPKKDKSLPYINSALPRLASPISPVPSSIALSRSSPNRPAAPRAGNSVFSSPPKGAVTSIDEVTITAHAISPSKRRTGSNTGLGANIPKLRPSGGALNDRPGAGNIARYPSSSPEKPVTAIGNVGGTSPSRRLRMQSPQKLRERLASESGAIKEADAALTAEMAKIGQELDALASQPGSSSSRPGTATSGASGSSSGSTQHSHLSNQSLLPHDPRVKPLENRLRGLEAAIPGTISSLSRRLTALDADVTSSLSVSEQKARRLDELLREATAENEELYGRFNEELAKVLKGVRDAPRERGVEEMKRQVAAANEEQERLRKENARLRREVVGLRAQLRE